VRSDFGRDILAGRLRLMSPPDIVRGLPQDWRDCRVWPHPVLGHRYEWERRFFASSPVKAGSYQRALVLAGGLFSLDVAEALQDKGLEVVNWDSSARDRRDIVGESVA